MQLSRTSRGASLIEEARPRARSAWPPAPLPCGSQTSFLYQTQKLLLTDSSAFLTLNPPTPAAVTGIVILLSELLRDQHGSPQRRCGCALGPAHVKPCGGVPVFAGVCPSRPEGDLFSQPGKAAVPPVLGDASVHSDLFQGKERKPSVPFEPLG